MNLVAVCGVNLPITTNLLVIRRYSLKSACLMETSKSAENQFVKWAETFSQLLLQIRLAELLQKY